MVCNIFLTQLFKFGSLRGHAVIPGAAIKLCIFCIKNFGVYSFAFCFFFSSNDLRNATFGFVSHSAPAFAVVKNAQTNKINILKSIFENICVYFFDI